MYQEERICKIMELLRQRKTLSNAEIMETFHISRDTARRDILMLVEEGFVVRTHGGVTLLNRQIAVPHYQERICENEAVKKELALRASSYFAKDQVCFMDASTTIVQICNYVPDSAIVYTNSLDNIDKMVGKKAAIHILGGKLNRENRFFYGCETINQINDIHFDIAFIGASAIGKDGIYSEDAEDAAIKKTAAKRAAFRCVVADASKFIKRGKFKGVPFENVDVIISNKMPQPDLLEALKINNTSADIFEEQSNET